MAHPGSRSVSAEFVELHVFIVPSSLWLEKYKTAYNNVVLESSSAGFVRVSPSLRIDELRHHIYDQIGEEDLPKSFVFLRMVGRCMAVVNWRQELKLQAKHFHPPIAYSPEIFILPGSHQSLSVRDSVESSVQNSIDVPKASYGGDNDIPDTYNSSSSDAGRGTDSNSSSLSRPFSTEDLPLGESHDSNHKDRPNESAERDGSGETGIGSSSPGDRSEMLTEPWNERRKPFRLKSIKGQKLRYMPSLNGSVSYPEIKVNQSLQERVLSISPRQRHLSPISPRENRTETDGRDENREDDLNSRSPPTRCPRVVEEHTDNNHDHHDNNHRDSNDCREENNRCGDDDRRDVNDRYSNNSHHGDNDGRDENDRYGNNSRHADNDHRDENDRHSNNSRHGDNDRHEDSHPRDENDRHGNDRDDYANNDADHFNENGTYQLENDRKSVENYHVESNEEDLQQKQFDYEKKLRQVEHEKQVKLAEQEVRRKLEENEDEIRRLTLERENEEKYKELQRLIQLKKDLEAKEREAAEQLADESQRQRDEKRSKVQQMKDSIAAARNDKFELQKEREAILRGIKVLNADGEEFNEPIWRNKFLEEKGKTKELEDQLLAIRKSIDERQKDIVSSLNKNGGPNSLGKKTTNSKDRAPSELASQRIILRRLKQRMDETQSRVENTKVKLSNEIKLRSEVEEDLRILRPKVTQTKIKKSLTRSSNKNVPQRNTTLYRSPRN